MCRSALQFLPLLAVVLLQPARGSAQEPAPNPAAEAELRETIRQYDKALRSGDAAAAGQFWAAEYIFVNARGELLTRGDRIRNLQTGRTALDSIVHIPGEEQFRFYGDGDVAVYIATLTLRGQYSGVAQQGRSRVVLVWVHRDGRWQQVASQQTTIAEK